MGDGRKGNKMMKVTITLTSQELTDIRVAVLTRLDKINQTMKKDDLSEKERQLLHTTYTRVQALMQEGGVLHEAVREIGSHDIAF